MRDYRIGSDEEPTMIRQVASTNGTADGFQAFQGPGGRMVALMQMNDTGARGGSDTYVSISSGGGWSPPVDVTNNAGRTSFVTSPIGIRDGVGTIMRYTPGRAAGAFDSAGHLLLLMVNNENGLFGVSSYGELVLSGSTSVPTLQFLRL
jgi:hypothetical protein